MADRTTDCGSVAPKPPRLMYAIAYDCEGRAVWISDIPHAAAMAARDLDRANPTGAPHFAEVVDPGATESGSHADDLPTDAEILASLEQGRRERDAAAATMHSPGFRSMECRSVAYARSAALRCRENADALRQRVAAAATRNFPVLYDVQRASDAPASVPWSILNERRAKLNHSQDLETLASRGGLAPREIFCNVFDLHWKDAPPDVAAIAWLRTVATTEQESVGRGEGE